jgi:antitoxin (DNA-binding transcriptional repressor) of toxin-antitoxin stability system
LNSFAAGGSVVAMEQTIPSGALRRQPGICLARASRGETFVVLRHGRPVAILRPPREGETTERRSATLMWRNMRDLLAEGRRKAVLITWYGVGTAVLEPLPVDWRPGAQL